MDRVIYEANEENLIFTSSPARMCQGDYKEETFFDKPSFVQVVTYVVTSTSYTISISALRCKRMKEMKQNKSPEQMTSPMKCEGLFCTYDIFTSAV